MGHIVQYAQDLWPRRQRGTEHEGDQRGRHKQQEARVSSGSGVWVGCHLMWILSMKKLDAGAGKRRYRWVDDTLAK